MLTQAQGQGAPCLPLEESVRLLGADAAQLDATEQSDLPAASPGIDHDNPHPAGERGLYGCRLVQAQASPFRAGDTGVRVPATRWRRSASR